MRIQSPRLGLCLVLSALSLALHPARTEAQTTCTTRTDCVDSNQPFTDRPPVVSIQLPADTVTSPRQTVTFTFADDFGLNAGTVTYSVLGGSLLTTPAWTWNKESTSAFAVGELNLAPGANSVEAQVCDRAGACRMGVGSIYYKTPPPAPAPRVAAAINTSVHRVEARNLATCDGCSETVMTYSIPAWSSVDRENTVTLFYSTHQADPRGFVDVEVNDTGTDPAPTMTMQVQDALGALVTLDNGTTTQHYRTGAGISRLAASWPAADKATGMYTYTLIIRSLWPDGDSRESRATVKVPIVNEQNSPFGVGVTIAGYERVHAQADGALITDGAGGIQWFAKTSCDTNNICQYQSPPGDQSRLVGMNGYWDRYYEDGGFSEYWGTGRIIFRQDRFKWRTTYHYDGSLTRLEGISDIINQRANLAYYPGGYLESITDPFGRKATIGYANVAWGRVFAADGSRQLEMSYDTRNRLTGWYDARNGYTDVTYDPASGKRSRVEGPPTSDGVTSGRQTVLVRSREATLLPLAGTGTAATPARRVTADSVATVAINPLGQATRVMVDPFGLATRIAMPLDTTRITRNARGQITSASDGKGNSRSYTYSSSFPYRTTGVSMQGPDGSMSYDLSYGVFGSVSRLRVNPNGLTAAVTYDFVLDSVGRATTVKRNGTVVETATFEGPRVLTRTDAGGHTSTYTYQSAAPNNLSSVTSGGVTTQYRYDALGRSVQRVTAGAASDSVGFDLLNRVTYRRDPAGGVTRTGFAGNGVDVSEIIDPLNQRYGWVHDAAGAVLHQIDPAGDSVSAAYFPATGLLRSLTTRRNQGVSFTYDAEGRVRTRTADGATTTWSYDPARRWEAVETPASRDTLRYDSRGKITESVTWRDGRRYGIRRTYTDRNLPDSVVVAGPWGTRGYVYTYDAYGRLDGLRDYAGKWTRMYLNDEGMMDSVRLPTAGNMRLSFSVSPRHQLLSVKGPVALSHEYRYTGRGLLRVDSTQNVNYPLRWHAYAYDALDRLSSWTFHMYVVRPCIGRDCAPTLKDSVAQQATFLWDSVGNPRGATLGAGNRLRSYAGFSMDYDADGNLVRKYNASGWDQALTWNSLGQLTGVSRTGAASVTYAYDGFGRRVKRTDASTGAVTHFIYDGDDLALEVDGAGNLVREYTYYPGTDRPHSMRQWANGAGGAVYYYVTQEPGHVQALVSATDTLVNQYRYTPFGMALNGVPAPGTPNPLQFMARELDAGTGLYYVRNRWYDPQVGRFVSEDPIWLAAGLNPYTFVENRPTMLRDPSGLSSGCVYGRVPTTDPHYGNSYWEFNHNGQVWYGQTSGGSVVLCPKGGGGGDGGAGASGGGGGGGSGGSRGGRASFSDRCHAVMDAPAPEASGPVMFGSLSTTVAAGLGGYLSGVGFYFTGSGDYGFSQTQGAAAGIDISADAQIGMASSMSAYAGGAYFACGGGPGVGACVGGSSSGVFISGGPSWGVPAVNGSIGASYTQTVSLRQIIADAICR
ncbi:RHS repeat-associated core domain-containing protein [Longimicrobium sp.]|uniref:RHS repeat domain-containing protein n=1 Tax=Longimicrobium sp. TaxID=2029185 RepID=UPI002E2EE90C|nr:RHS repeat-associated core domain-containing protein [Longimicrobium sp.]HEX6041486.1 RHS repeat-associated core domain-containing protein [Longimicrobium sp.]